MTIKPTDNRTKQQSDRKNNQQDDNNYFACTKITKK